jgi:hypothetical protein
MLWMRDGLCGARFSTMDSAVLGLGTSGCVCCVVLFFLQILLLEDAIGSPACTA